jgi:hypothetical protein
MGRTCGVNKKKSKADEFRCSSRQKEKKKKKESAVHSPLVSLPKLPSSLLPCQQPPATRPGAPCHFMLSSLAAWQLGLRLGPVPTVKSAPAHTDYTTLHSTLHSTSSAASPSYFRSYFLFLFF